MSAKIAEKISVFVPANRLNERPSLRSLVKAFWLGATQPNAGVALSAVVLTLVGVLLFVGSSTEARVRRTDAASWLRRVDDAYGHLTSLSIQGAERHARGPGATIVFVGPSVLQSLLLLPAELDPVLTGAIGRPARGLDLTAGALSAMESAAVVDRFGTHFDGWLVLGVNRHTLARNLKREQDRKTKLGFWVTFDSAVLDDELSRAGLPAARVWGVPLLDHSGFYCGSLAGWRYFGRKAPVYVRPLVRSSGRVTPAKIRATNSIYEEAAFVANLGVLARIAERSRASGGARLVIVECPFADEVIAEVQTAAWRRERERFNQRRDAWVAEHGIPWIDVTSELGLKAEDFIDPQHVGSPEVRRRFLTVVARRLAAMEP